MKRLFALTLCLSMAVCLLACEQQELRSPATFYYHRSETIFSGSDGVFAPEQRELAGIGEDLGAILALYCEGPVSSALENPLPPGASVQSFTLEDGVLTLHFDSSLAELGGIDLTVAAGCLARTFLELTEADTLVLTAGGALLNGQTAMRLSLADLELRDSSLDQFQKDFTVYYTDLSRRYLIGQEISVNPAVQEELPFQLLELLLTPPSSSGLRSALPEGTRVLSAAVEDGLCTVDLSPEFENRRFYSHTGQLLSLMSVVNTLTALPQIDRVEFTIEGNLLIRYGSLSIAEPLVRDERCIGPVRTGLGERDATLYLAHGEEGRLLPMAVRLRQTGALSRAELIVRHLLSDPGTNAIRTCIPEQTRLNSITLSDGICYVDLSEEYLDAPKDLLWSGRVIAASLCTLEEIEQVQLLVNGAVPAEFDSAWFGPLTPNVDWYL